MQMHTALLSVDTLSERRCYFCSNGNGGISRKDSPQTWCLWPYTLHV